MTTYTRNGEPISHGPFIAGEGATEVEHPAVALTNWSDEELAAFGIVRTEVPVPEPTVADRLQALADFRWQRSLTFFYDGVPNAPADSALSAVTGFVVAAQIVPPTGPTTWKLAAGEFRSWTFEQVVAYGIAIRGHIQSCFDREEVLTEMIIAAEDPASIDITTGWPS